MTTIQKILRRFGLQLRREPNWGRLIADNLIEQVIDVGANHGQFYRRIRPHFTGHIVSFEPNSEITRELITNKQDDQWHVHTYAVSDFNGTATLRIGQDDAGAHLDASGKPGERAQQVCVTRLDTFFTRDVPTLLKTDAEGHDLRVMHGAGEFLRCCPVVIMKVALERRFSYEPLIGDVLLEMKLLGYQPALFDRCAYDHSRSRETAVDVLFLRR